MKKTLAVLVLAGAISLAGIALAGPPGHDHDKGGPGMHHKMFDPKRAETVTGEVLAVELMDHGKMKHRGQGDHDMGGMHHRMPAHKGVLLKFKTAKETLTVHVGPDYYVNQQGFAFAPKDQLEVMGSRTTMHGRTMLMAATIKKGDKTLKLIDASSGKALWMPPAASPSSSDK